METAARTEEIERVKREIVAAFSYLRPPVPDQVIGPTQGYPESEERVRQAFVGKTWQVLDATFFKERWSGFCFFSAESFRYYVPVMLLCGLTSGDADLLHSSIFTLTPSYWTIYDAGEDDQFAYQTSLFTEDQHAAVCAFLELGLLDLLGYKFRSAQALRWGWNRWETRAVERCRAYFHGLHHAEMPPSSIPEVRVLATQIRDAFAEVPYPGDQAICHCHRDDEPSEYALAFRGLDWRTLHPELLSALYSTGWFTDEALRYFLPAYLIADLTSSETRIESNCEPVLDLTSSRELGKPDRFAAYSQIEREAIVAYLQHRLKEDQAWGGTPDPEIAAALESYWLPGARA